MINKISLENFTLFHKIEMELSPKINIIIGENGTGKTQLLKAAYAASSSRQQIGATNSDDDVIRTKMTERLIKLFLPLDDKLGKLHRNGADTNAKVNLIFGDGNEIELGFYNNSQAVSIKGKGKLEETLAAPLYLPTKEVLSFMKGFSSLYQRFDLSFDQTYQDICLSLDLPEIRNDAMQEKAKWAIEKINEVIGGKFVFYGGGKVTFKSERNEYSANVVAEGFRKVGMLARLLETGAIQPGISGTMFWDEPESNLNPKLMEMLVEILLELSRQGLQIVLATHDYVFLKWFDLLANEQKGDEIRFHALYRQDGQIKVEQAENYKGLSENAISDTYSNLTKAQVKRNMGDLGK
ncbi:AAA family ATPase [Acinetobacter guillouiae]|uniref:AAA family ATPase n=1 Tax=Acinetobacter TaxID=469 RepID=UPI00125093CA|nr:AAA family ATPase [Acinetobacter ursingii]